LITERSQRIDEVLVLSVLKYFKYYKRIIYKVYTEKKKEIV